MGRVREVRGGLCWRASCCTHKAQREQCAGAPTTTMRRRAVACNYSNSVPATLGSIDPRRSWNRSNARNSECNHVLRPAAGRAESPLDAPGSAWTVFDAPRWRARAPRLCVALGSVLVLLALAALPRRPRLHELLRRSSLLRSPRHGCFPQSVWNTQRAGGRVESPGEAAAAASLNSDKSPRPSPPPQC